MDSNFKKILKLYNTRRVQLWLLFGLIFLFISIIIPFVGFLILKYILNQPQNQNNQSQGGNSQNNQNYQSQESNIPINQNQERNIPTNQNQERNIPFSVRQSENQEINNNDN